MKKLITKIKMYWDSVCPESMGTNWRHVDERMYSFCLLSMKYYYTDK